MYAGGVGSPAVSGIAVPNPSNSAREIAGCHGSLPRNLGRPTSGRCSRTRIADEQGPETPADLEIRLVGSQSPAKDSNELSLTPQLHLWSAALPETISRRPAKFLPHAPRDWPTGRICLLPVHSDLYAFMSETVMHPASHVRDNPMLVTTMLMHILGQNVNDNRRSVSLPTAHRACPMPMDITPNHPTLTLNRYLSDLLHPLAPSQPACQCIKRQKSTRCYVLTLYALTYTCTASGYAPPSRQDGSLTLTTDREDSARTSPAGHRRGGQTRMVPLAQPGVAYDMPPLAHIRVHPDVHHVRLPADDLRGLLPASPRCGRADAG